MHWLFLPQAARHWPLLMAGALAGGVGAAALPPYRPGRCAPETRLQGLTLAEARSGHGVIVTSLRSGSAAALDGIAVGDRVEGINGRRIGGLRQLESTLKPAHAGPVPVLLRHAGHELAVELAEDCHDAADSRGRR